MPFTGSHPAAVLPLVRWGLSGSALVLGSIAPDMPTLLPVPAVVHFAHTPLGLVTIDLAIGLIGFVLWQALLGPAVVAIAPQGLRTRVPEGAPAGLAFHCARSGRVLAAVGLGAATHLLWDSFTHDWMWGPQHLPWLASRHGPWMGWQWAQHVSDVAPVAILIVWVVGWWRAAPARNDIDGLALPIRVVAWLVVLGPAAVGFVYGLAGGSLFLAFTRGGALGVIGLVLVAVAWSAADAARRRSGG
jgi:uncharacterized protein DUF4184